MFGSTLGAVIGIELGVGEGIDLGGGWMDPLMVIVLEIFLVHLLENNWDEKM